MRRWLSRQPRQYRGDACGVTELLNEQPLTESTAVERADEFIASIGDYPDTYEGRGIVICGGGLRYFTNAWVAISLLRHTGCRLPIQLWYLGKEELDGRMEELVAPLGVECVDATAMTMLHPARILRGWELKPYAILYSPFREVLLLDADNCVATDPEFLFDSWEYREAGAVFWPDLGRMHSHHSAWIIFGVRQSDEPEIESGQILVNKQRCWRALSLTKYYNDYSDFYYRYVHGDKETFHLAFRKVEQPYAMPTQTTRFESGTFFQSDFDGKVVFQHRVGAKWNFDGETPTVPGFQLEAECRRFLDELRVVWDGKIGHPRQQPADAQLASLRKELTDTLYRFSPDGRTYRTMSFASDGRVSLGAGPMEKRWRVCALGGRLVVEIGPDGDGKTQTVIVREPSGWRTVSGSGQLVGIPRNGTGSTNSRLSLTEFIQKISWYAGAFAWHQYALAREMAPDLAVVIGSFDSPAALTIARGMQDNGCGRVVLVDEPQSDDDFGPLPFEVTRWFDLFGVTATIQHLRTSLPAALAVVREMGRDQRIQLLVIDRAFEQDDQRRELAGYLSLLSSGVLLSRVEGKWVLLPFDAASADTADQIKWDRGLVLAAGCTGSSKNSEQTP